MNYPTSDTDFFLHTRVIKDCSILSAVLFAYLVERKKQTEQEEFIVKKEDIFADTQISYYKQTHIIKLLEEKGFISQKRVVKNQIAFKIIFERLKID